MTVKSPEDAFAATVPSRHSGSKGGLSPATTV
jgi:hypothetical protein